MGFFGQIYISAPVLGTITALIAISRAVIVVAKTKSEQTAGDYGLLLIIGLFYGAAGAVTPFAYSLNPAYGILHYSLVLLCAVINVLVQLTRSESNIMPVSGYTSLVITIILQMIAMPLAVLPYVNAEALSLSPPVTQEIRIETITETFSRIKDGLSEIERDIALESENIDQSIENLTKDIEARNMELRTLVQEQSRMAEEIRISRALADLTGEEAKAVVDALNRGKTADKFLDYGVGFGLGLLSSGFFFVMQRFTATRPQLATQQPSP